MGGAFLFLIKKYLFHDPLNLHLESQNQLKHFKNYLL